MPASSKNSSTLRLSASRFAVEADIDTPTASWTRDTVRTVASPLKTTLLLLESDTERIAFICTDFNFSTFRDYGAAWAIRRIVAQGLGLSDRRVLLFFSHNHSDARLAEDIVPVPFSDKPPPPGDQPIWTSTGRRFIGELKDHLGRLSAALQPVSAIRYAVGKEARITYNRKGYRAAGTSFFMREEDRLKVATDYSGDIDSRAPLLLFENRAGIPIAGLIQFTGHPVTTFQPENPVVHGDYPMVATDCLARHLQEQHQLEQPVPIGFLQGCAGDVNSKQMFSGGVETGERYGKQLGESLIQALGELKESASQNLALTATTAKLPMATLPSVELLQQELKEMDQFIVRAHAGDPDTLQCVGYNFPTFLSPRYRASLVEQIRPWNEWALQQHRDSTTSGLPTQRPVRIEILTIGDITIVGIPGEPFLQIGRELVAKLPASLVIPCGYINYTIGYIPNSGNVDGNEYMSAFYRCTGNIPPYAKPAGDVIVDAALAALGNS